MAFGARAEDARKGVAAGAEGRARRRRRAFGAVPAVSDLGLIVVDEEHDPAYKQEDRVFYNARDMAVVRAIGSADFRSCCRLQHRRSKAGTTPSRAATAMFCCPALCRSGLPDLEARRHAAHAAGARRVPVAAAAERHGETLERRGAGASVPQPARLCAADAVPGLRPPVQCPDCSSWLVEHRFRGQLLCHHCGHTSRCRRPARNAARLTTCRLRAGDRADRGRSRQAFPRCARPSCCRRTCWADVKRLRLELEAIEKGEVDIVIGTQLVAKGHNFPN
jgi:primosomal protein N' (replication factor Y)